MPIYYDPVSPVMLPPERIAGMGQAELQAASDQIDQNMVVLLQKIEENFARCNQTVIERILPAVTQHGENSQRIYESVKFWKPFFEAAAAQRYSDQDTEVPEGDSNVSQNHLPQHDPDGSLSFADASQISGDSASVGGTPRANASAHVDNGPAGQVSEDASIYERLQADFNQLGLPPSKYDANTSTATDVSKDIHRLRLSELPPDSPDNFPEMPDFETVNHTTRKPSTSHYEQPSPSISAANSSLPFPTSTRPVAPSAQNPMLHQLLNKKFAQGSPRKGPGSSTPGPSNLPRGWPGVVDLSQTPLSAFASPIKRQGEAADESGWDHALGSATRHLSSSPLPHSRSAHASFDFGSPMPSRTPAKEAARRMTQDVYDATAALEDSPLPQPPSVMKEWQTRNFADLMGTLPAPSPSEGRRKGFEEEEEAFEGHEEEGQGEESFDAGEQELNTLRMGGLADYGGGTTAKIDDLLGEQSFARLVDDDEADRFGRLGLDEQDESYTMEAPEEHQHQQHLEEQSYLLDEGISEDVSIVGIAPPEDTFFGAGAKSQQQKSNRSLFDEDLTSPDDRQAQGFRMMGEVDHTLHGGQLLESEPFEHSPLQGRNRGEQY